MSINFRSIVKWRAIFYDLAGETIEAKMHENVTMLFSDIVGFTSICSTATPMMVVNMLQNLYTQFDAFCGQLDVYKVFIITTGQSVTFIFLKTIGISVKHLASEATNFFAFRNTNIISRDTNFLRFFIK